MVATVCQSLVAVEDLYTLSHLPSVDDQRPSSCPLCGQPARPPGSLIKIVGNGTYRRQVLGLVEPSKSLLIFVRRYVCLGCHKSISVLPDSLLPGRWYTGTSMLLALVLSLLLGQSATAVRRRLAQPGETSGWKTLGRWHRQLLAPLWSWVAAQIGFADQCPGSDRVQRAKRLRRLLSLQGVHARSPDAEIEQAARALAVNTAHDRGKILQIQRVC